MNAKLKAGGRCVYRREILGGDGYRASFTLLPHAVVVEVVGAATGAAERGQPPTPVPSSKDN